MRVLFLDCFSGISGDMTVGALCDLGVKPSALEWELSKLDLGQWHAHFSRDSRQHLHGVRFSIHENQAHEGCTHEEHSHTHPRGAQFQEIRELPHPISPIHSQGHGHAHSHGHGSEHGHSHSHEHGHSHEHPHVHGRTHAQIRELILKSELSEFVKKHALSMFQRIAVAEGKIHGVAPEEVAFHEVGALDSIADIILVCVGLEMLGVEKVFVSKLHDGCGWIDCAHGRFPIPSAATLEILSGIPVSQIDEPFEFITPTGAAIVAEFGASFGLMPEMQVEKVGYGIGTRKLLSRPNVLRAALGILAQPEAGAYETDEITRLETNLDDLSPEVTGAVMEKLLAAGALDVFFTPIQMKKNRPAIQLSVLCEQPLATHLADILFSETTAFGLRMEPVRRLKLWRKFEKVQTPFGEITVKLGLRGTEVIQVAPEFESCKVAAEKAGAPLREVYEAARAACAKG